MTPVDQKEALIQQRLAEERDRLAAELGIEESGPTHFHRPVEREFTKQQRGSTTVLYGGLTLKHELLIQAALEGQGYKCEPLPVPDVRAFQLGKEYGNNGQCNPTYFTVGNLVQHLQRLEEDGLARERILDDYVFITAGACGPCRFGMYEAEYRLALRNSGFDGFRVLLFQQGGGLTQSGAEAGIEMNADFFLGLLNAMNMGDLLNDVGYQIRPFEVEQGAVDAAMADGMDLLRQVLRGHEPFQIERSWARFLKGLPKLGGLAEPAGKFIDQFKSDEYTAALAQVRDRLAEVRLDRTRVKPIVKITGEFWAQTTEGDGNFNMFPFLEREGAQVVVEPVGTWIMYMIHQAKQKMMDERGTREGEELPSSWRLDQRMANDMRARKRAAKLTVAEKAFEREWNRFRAALNDIPHPLTDQYELQRLGHPLYNSRAGGGEGHLEVAKNIYYSNKDLCHMVLSLKPFGCMPSTQSDGVQSAVVNLYKDIIYLPIETSGEGEINAHSRVQMALGEAKAKTKGEAERVQEHTGLTFEQVREYAADHPHMESAMYHVPHAKGWVSTAANFNVHVAELWAAERKGRAAITREVAEARS